MHVVIVADHAHVNGGQAKVAIDSAVGLSERGRRVTFFAAVAPVDPRLAAAGVEVVSLDQPDVETARSQVAFLAQTMWNFKAEAALARVLDAVDPAQTVVHVHAWAKSLSPSIGRALVGAGPPVVYTMHEFFLVCPNGGFYDYQRHESCERVPLSRACVSTNCDARAYPRKLMRVARHLILDHVSGLPEAIDDVICISDMQQAAAAPYLPPRARLRRLGNPIAIEPQGAKTQAGRYFLYVGRLSDEKGVAVFCEAARRVGTAPVIVGDGRLRASLERSYPEARFLGWRRPEEVSELMRAARALVFPSVWREGQPLTVQEALALGTPVIVSDACAGREAVIDGENGFWFRSRDADDLARAMRRLADDETAARVTREAYQRYWAQPLTLARHLDGLETIYREALAAARSRAPRSSQRTRAVSSPQTAPIMK